MPTLRSLTSVRFAAIGDYGDGSADEASVAALVDSKNPEFIVTVGDNSYGSNDIDVNIGQFYSDYIGNYTGYLWFGQYRKPLLSELG